MLASGTDKSPMFEVSLMRRVATAPAKAIMFGEHAVLYGAPAIAVAVDLRAKVTLDDADEWMLNGQPLDPSKNPHLASLIRWASAENNPKDIHIESEIPIASGLGSSASLSASIGALLATESISKESIARAAHSSEAEAQGGRASPVDTSTVTLGGAVVVSNERWQGIEHCWDVDLTGPDGDRHWAIHSLSLSSELTSIPLVIGSTGKGSSTAKMVASVAARMHESDFRESMNRLIACAEDSIHLMMEGDPFSIGGAMNRCHALLREIGVSSPEIEVLIEAVLPHSFGAKMTGAGGGGCILALTQDPESCAAAIRSAGGEAFVTTMGAEGVRIEDSA